MYLFKSKIQFKVFAWFFLVAIMILSGYMANIWGVILMFLCGAASWFIFYPEVGYIRRLIKEDDKRQREALSKQLRAMNMPPLHGLSNKIYT